MLIAGYQPYECAAQGKAQGDACDFLSFAGLPARIIVRFTERYDKFFGVRANIERVTAFSRTRSRIDGKSTASDDPEKEYAD